MSNKIKLKVYLSNETTICDRCKKEISIRFAHMCIEWIYCEDCYIKYLEKERDE